MLNITHSRSNSFSYRLINDFNLITVLIFILGFINIFYKIRWTNNGLESAVNLWNPTWLLFGPLLLYAYGVFVRKGKTGKKKIDYLHLLPFFIFSIFYLIALLDTKTNDPWQNVFFTYYQNSFFVIFISLLSYAFYILVRTQRIHAPKRQATQMFLITMSTIYILTGMIIVIMFLAWGIVKVDIGIDYRLFSYSLLFFANIAIAWYWIFVNKESSASKIEHPAHKSYRNSALDEALANSYKNRITKFFETSTVYLEPNLSLDSLANELDIPRHYLSQLFNVFFKKNFHAFVADYRISYAIKLLDDNHNRLTIESLAYSCGFNSKTSFNRYFKDKTGLTPSAYQLQVA
ncbi:MAG: helix-turn-helix domain-containing protein [Bacteroidota bacterium]